MQLPYRSTTCRLVSLSRTILNGFGQSYSFSVITRIITENEYSVNVSLL